MKLNPWPEIIIWILTVIGLLALIDPNGWYKPHNEPPTAWYE